MLDGRMRATVERGLTPIGRGLQRAGITADVLTVFGLLWSVLTAVLIGAGELRWAVVGIVVSGLNDLLDGTVARHSGQAGPRGAFFDSVMDRVSDAVVFGGVAWYLAGQSRYLPVLALAAAALAMLISYERARAEALGYDGRGGLMERAERMVVLGVALFFHVLVPALWVMVALMALTAVHRFVKVWRQASNLPPRPRFLTPRRPRRTADGEPVERPTLRGWWEQRAPGAGRPPRAPRRARRSRP